MVNLHKKVHFDSDPIKGLTLVEVIVVIAILVLLTATVSLTLTKFLQGRSVETVAENLISLIRSAQASAKDTESAQVVLLAREEAVWMRGEEVIRKQILKNKVKVTELELEGKTIEVPEEPTEEVKISIDEKGNVDSAAIVLAKGEESITVSVGGSIVTSGSLGVLESGLVIPAEAGIQSNEEALIVQTEPLQARGWQIIQVNNVDTVSEGPAGSSVQGKVKEVKLRVRLDSRLPTSAHLHAYVFPGWYENKPVAHGVTGQQTMLDNNGTAPTYRRDSPLLLYREATEDCLTFFAPFYTISGILMKENGEGLANFIIRLTRFPLAFTLTTTDSNGYYKFEGVDANNATYVVSFGGRYVNGHVVLDYRATPHYQHSPLNENKIDNFVAWANNLFFELKGTINGPSMENVLININHVKVAVPSGNDVLSGATEAFNSITDKNGLYSISLEAHHYYEIKPVKTGYSFDPSAVTIFLNGSTTQNLKIKRVEGGNPFTFNDDKPPLGDWSYSESEMQNAVMLANIAVLSNEIKGYYIYKNKIIPMQSVIQSYIAGQSLPMFNKVFYNSEIEQIELTSIYTSDNTLNPGGSSDFAAETASLVFETVNETITYDNAHWENGYSYSSFAGQSAHTLAQLEEETRQTGWSQWLTIPVSSLPAQTKFVKIAIALYHYTDSGEQLFNQGPTVSSAHPVQTTISASKFVMDYETDPFIVYSPWFSLTNDPFWLSNYAYAMKPILRPYGVNVLAAKGPFVGENYRNTGNPYKGFWYGPLYLDWDLILGNENLYCLIGWTTGAFELTNERWRYSQQGDSYGNTALAPPSHYLLKNFAYLSYWYLFQYGIYNQPSADNLPKSLQDNSAKASLRFQEPLNLSRTGVSPVNSWMKLFERTDPSPTSIPWESSSLSIPLLNNPEYPVWLANLPPVFGQAKLCSSPDLYSSYYYLQERINHIMEDIGVWTILTAPIGTDPWTAAISIFDMRYIPGGIFDTDDSLIIGNFESWSADTLTASWWNWYQNIPWAKAQAFPKKTGIDPNNYEERIGWERPVITQPASYWDYFSSTLVFKNDPNNSYNAREVVNAPHTIFMSTSHYPLGTVQISVKK